MPNAANIKTEEARPKILALGQTGGGKTSAFLTLPGKKFAYLFDPNALLSLKGHDIDYEEFLPDKISLKLTSLKESTRKKIGINRYANKGGELYSAWEDDFEGKIESGFFDSYDWICFDSFTTLSDMVMDGILAINGRGGQWPQQDDYGPQMLGLTSIMRTATSLKKGIYVTGHIEVKQDELTKKIFYTPLMTGRLRAKLPLLFSEILLFEAQSDQKGNVNYIVQTKADRMMPIIRTTMKKAIFREDITIDFSDELTNQGLGGLMKGQGLI